MPMPLLRKGNEATAFEKRPKETFLPYHGTMNDA
jgi:hypothetical protein